MANQMRKIRVVLDIPYIFIISITRTIYQDGCIEGDYASHLKCLAFFAVLGNNLRIRGAST
jgi:hypothetical protein